MSRKSNNTLESSLEPATPQFEKLRQEQETRNEIVINYIYMAILGGAFMFNLATRFLPVAPYRVSDLGLLLISGSFAARLAVFFYLRSAPPYRPARKYILSTLDIAVFTLAALMLGTQGAFSWLVISLFNVCTYAMAVALSGLRYSTRVVAFSGISTVLLHTFVFAIPLEAAFRVPATVIGLLTQGSIALCAAYTVASLTRVHRDAALKEQLARFLPPELVEQVVKQPGLLQRTTERRNATVIFADIRGFTRLSETMSPEKVVEFLNDFLEEMTVAILDQKGMLDKYIGDAVMGVFGVPVHADDHALRALRAAIDMRDRLKKLNVNLRQKQLPELSVGIGLHTGELLIGAIGSTRRLDYTVIGDTVNVASRIEGMTRSYPVEILLSDATRDAIGGAVDLHEIATVQVKNRDEPLTLWSPDLPRKDVDDKAVAGPGMARGNQV
jgi:class 3 adenylate cyclase